ncbi:hypothetical protein [Bacillus alkalicellulosilyticus]|uniref:hypothetical protein n=1 Tax=Alkalihalobacterium alkalicellulosilyticum TaxID=1912214 RepID=UPI0009977C23|nr:hypothetical protein [Bacillus alkalicellulosilyticus]
MKHFGYFVFIVMLILTTAACSSTEKAEGSSKNKGQEVNQEQVDFENSVFSLLDRSDSLLSTFNTALDGLYTEKQTPEQFAKAMKLNIESSRELVSELERLEVHHSWFEVHQNLIGHFNNKHELYLNAIEMANNNRLIKDRLRSEFLTLKQTQAEIYNTWNQTQVEQQ